MGYGLIEKIVDEKLSRLRGMIGELPTTLETTFVGASDSRLTDARTPTAHAASHADGGGDDVDILDLAGYAGGSPAAQFLREDRTWAVPPSGAGTVTNTGTLTDHAVMVGNGSADMSALASLGTAGHVLTSAGSGADPAFAALPIQSAKVITDETQAASAAYGDLATAGPAVTLTLQGTTAILWFCAGAYKTGGAGNTAFVSVAVSGASTVAASDNECALAASPGASLTFDLAGMAVLTGLTAGSNTFTLKYHNDGGTTWHFHRRSLTVFAP